MPIAHTATLDIYYERGGNPDASPLLFISGSGGDLRNKPNQFDSPLASAFDLIGYDQRGLGQTAQPDGAYTMAQYADDAAALLDDLELRSVPVVGVSFGGMVAQEFALRHPDRVQALVLACTSSGGAGGASYPLHELHDLEPLARAEAHLKVADLIHTDTWIADHPESWQKRLDLAMRPAPAGVDEQTAQVGAAKQLEARRRHDTYSRLPELQMPVLLAGGERDGIAPVTNMQAIHEQIGNSELKLFAGGHMFLIQDKTAYPYLIDWLQQQL